MAYQIFTITAPVFLLALAGWVWARTGAPFDLAFVTRLSLTFSIPCLIFATLVKADIDPAAFRDIALASVTAYGVLAAVFWGVFRAMGLPMRVWLAPTVFGNTGNVGLPVALFAYGQQGLALAMVIFSVMAILSFTVGISVVAGVGRPAEAARQPLVYASVAGGVFAIMHWHVPGWVLASLSLAGQVAIPLMLLTLGVSIARLHIGGIGRAALVAILKLAICGTVGLGVSRLFGLGAEATGTMILQLVMPAAVTSYMVAARYEADPDAVAGLVVASTLLSLAAIPGTLALLL